MTANFIIFHCSSLLPQLKSSSSSISSCTPTLKLELHQPSFHSFLSKIQKMEAVLTALLPIFAKCCDPLCGHANLKVDNFLKFRTNLEALGMDFRFVEGKKNQITAEIEQADKNNGQKPTVEISVWLEEFQKIETRVNQILDLKPSTCCFNCSNRFKLSNEVAETMVQVTWLKNNCNPPYTMDAPVEAVEQLPGPSIKDQETAARNLAIIKEHLQNDRLGILGMLGMGGIGKTTLIINLNNELESFNKEQESKPSGKPFTVVIWVTVSSKLNLEDLQNQIAQRLKLPKKDGETMQEKAIRLFRRLKMEKRFIVILDDVWKGIKLEDIGIPNPKDHVGSKVILTTRKEEVCKAMGAEIFKVITLNPDESWNLFKERAGPITDSEEIGPLAKLVVKECGGLPLAIITVGCALRGKERIELWNHALTTLRKARPEKYLEEELFSPLKLSYDLLEGNNIQPCFLYCSLYPEDFPIDENELIQCWIAEGLIDEQDDHKETYNEGIVLIEKLKESCLLERGNQVGTVKMHDVVRDVAVWIASSPDGGCKSFIRSGVDLHQIPRAQTWEYYRRVSFMNNKIEMLPDSVPQCSKVSTLLLQGNAQLRKIPFGFLQGFLALRVLNLSGTSITSLPPVERLGELRALFLKSCLHLRQFPPLRGLSRLQVLDLSGTRMELPADDAALKLKELSFQHHLLEFYVDFNTLPSITFQDSNWLTKLGRFRICIGSTKDAYATPHNERVVQLCDISSSSEAVSVFWSNASALIMVRSQCINDMWAGYKGVNPDRLKSLTVDDCSWPGSMVTGNAQHDLLLPSLEVLFLHRIKNLPSISQIVVQFGTNIKIIELTDCHGLKQLFPIESIHKLESLEKLCVKSCKNLIEIIGSDSALPVNILPNLKTIELKQLPELICICKHEVPWSSLKHTEVKDCPLLKQLPVPVSSANSQAP